MSAEVGRAVWRTSSTAKAWTSAASAAPWPATRCRSPPSGPPSATLCASATTTIAIPLAERWTDGVASVHREHGLPWTVQRLGCRGEYWFCEPPRNGAAGRRRDRCRPRGLVPPLHAQPRGAADPVPQHGPDVVQPRGRRRRPPHRDLRRRGGADRRPDDCRGGTEPPRRSTSAARPPWSPARAARRASASPPLGSSAGWGRPWRSPPRRSGSTNACDELRAEGIAAFGLRRRPHRQETDVAALAAAVLRLAPRRRHPRQQCRHGLADQRLGRREALRGSHPRRVGRGAGPQSAHRLPGDPGVPARHEDARTTGGSSSSRPPRARWGRCRSSPPTRPPKRPWPVSPARWPSKWPRTASPSTR